MAAVRAGRCTANNDGDVVVFLIGMHINRLAKVHKWLPVAMAMPPMLKELVRHKEKGLLSFEVFRRGRTTLLLMYWRSFADLETFARDPDDRHLPAWRAFNRRVGTGGDVGIYHETYVIGPGQSESVYGNMPPFGLGKAMGVVPMERKGQSAQRRVTGTGPDEPALPVPAETA